MTVAAATAVRGAAASRSASTAARAGSGARSGKPAPSQPGAGGSGAGGGTGSGSAPRPATSPSGPAFPRVQPVVRDSAGGFALGVLAWVWLVLPFLRGGMPEVRNVLRAKFFNKGADGSWLP